MVTIYFSNGHEAQLRDAVEVKAEQLQGGAVGAAVGGIACLDAEGKVLGRFKLAEIVGYQVEK